MTQENRQPLTVLMVIPFYYPIVAGAEVFAQQTAEELTRRGHAVHILTRGSTHDGAVLPESDKVNGVHIHRVMSRWCDGSAVSTQKTIPAAISVPVLAQHTRRLIRKLKPDVVHSHVFPAGVAATLGALGTRTGQVYAEQQAGFKDYHPFLDNPVGYAFQRWVNRRVDVVQATSRAGATFASTHKARRTRVIPNGVHLPPESASLSWSPDQPLRICTVSRLEYKNGIDVLFDALAELSADGLEFHLDIVGDGSQRNALIAQANNLKIQGHIQFHGYMKHESIWQLLQTAHLFVRPSRQEGFGISFLEAMAAGVITIGTNVGGIPDILRDGINGFLAEPGDVASLSKNLQRACKVRETWPDMRKHALRDVTSKFRWDHITDALEALYYEVLP